MGKKLAALLALGLVAGVPARAGTDENAEAHRLDVASFDRVWTTIRDKHFDPSLGGLDWDAVRAELRPKVEAAKTRDAARAVMQDLVSRLGQSHFAILPAEIYDALGGAAGTGAGDGTTGLEVRVVDDRALVTRVDPGSPAADAGIRPGWVVTRVGDEDVATRIERVRAAFADGPYRAVAAVGAVTSMLAGAEHERRDLELLDGDDRAVKATLALAPAKGRKSQFGYLPPLHVWIETSRLDGDVGLIRFNMFLDPSSVMPEYDRAMRSFLDAKGVVIDLRGNSGGLPMMAMGMAGWLVSSKQPFLGTLTTRDGALKIVVFPRARTFGGPVAVLVDGLSASCAEIFAGGLQDLGRARVFGSRTMGAALPSTIEKLPNGDGFQYAFADYVSRGGGRLEANGVRPDVEIVPTRAALLAGADPVLDAALAWIREESKPKAAAAAVEEAR